jgi:hypothetical protein
MNAPETVEMDRDQAGQAGTMSKEVEEEIARVVDELLQRIRRGEAIEWPAVFRQYPRHAAELQWLAPTMEAVVKFLLENLSRGARK